MSDVIYRIINTIYKHTVTSLERVTTTTTTTTQKYLLTQIIYKAMMHEYRVQNIRNRINIRSVTWMTMLFEGGILV